MKQDHCCETNTKWFTLIVIIVSLRTQPIAASSRSTIWSGETVFGGCHHLEYMNIWCFREPK